MKAVAQFLLSICIIFCIACGSVWASDVEISEFMALNESTLADSYGNYSDWIELHNTTAASISLEGWYLTDDETDLTQWRLPAVTLAAGEYMVVFASGDDYDDPSAELHTNFKLSGNGEYLALVMSDGVTVAHEFTPVYPSQSDDISYGVIDGVEYFFADPTPGAANVRSNAGAVEFSIGSGTFVSSFPVSITAESPNALVYYTTNGATPTASSTLYAGPIMVSASTQLRAVAVETGKDNGPVASAYYLQLAGDVQSFDSNLPLVVLDTFGASVGQDYDTTTAVVVIDSTEGQRTTLLTEADYAGRSAIHIRGNSSTNFPKKQYRLELRDDSDEDVDADLMGLGSDSDWVLNAPYSDKTYMRNYLSYSWSKMMGDTAVDCKFCEVFLNSDGDGQISYEDYVGIFLLVENIKIDKERCQTEDMPDSPGSAASFNGGFIIEKETAAARLPEVGGYFNPDIRGGDNWVYRDPSPDSGMTADQKTYVKAKIDRWESVLWSSSQRPYYAQYCDEQSFVDYELLQQISKNNDGWYSSAFVWLNPDDELVAGPVWDFNIAYGNVYYGSSGTTYDWQDIRGWGWWLQIFKDADFSQSWTDRWFELRDSFLSDDAILAMVNDTASYLAEAEARDHARWPVLGEYVWPNPDGYENRDTWEDELDFLRDWLSDRTSWIDSQFVARPAMSHDSGVVAEGTAVSLNAASGMVYYTLDGSDPRSVGGSISGSAIGYAPGGYSVQTLISSTSTWKYNDTGTDLGTAWRGASYDDSSWSAGPAELGYGDGDEVTVVSYGGDSSNKYPTTYFRRNFIVSDASDVESFEINILYDDGAVVYVNGQEVMRGNMGTGTVSYSSYATAVASEGVWHSSGDLAASLLNDGMNVIAVEIHQRSGSSSDISFNLTLSTTVAAAAEDGIAVDGYTHIKARALSGGQWSAPVDGYFVESTLELPVITEINYHPYDLTDTEILSGATDEDEMEFLELYNPSDTTISLDGFEFVDGIEATLGSAATLAPGEYGVVISNASSFALRYGSSVKILGTYSGSLSNSGETVELVDFLGNPVANVTYDDSGDWPNRADGDGPSLELIDVAADPAVSSNWVNSVYFGGTPGAANGGPQGDIVINEVLTHTDLPQVDFIELHNTTAALVDISGWWLSDDSGQYDKFIIPSPTLIPAGGYVVFDEYDFNATGIDLDPSNDDPNDFGLNSYRGDDVYLVAASAGTPLRFVDHVEFDAAANGESFGRWPNATGELYPMASVTAAAANSYPRVGPVVVSEIMYSISSGDDNLQFIEIYNCSGQAIDLTDWHFDKGVSFDFPTGFGILPGEYMLITPFDPDEGANSALVSAFVAEYGVDAEALWVGGWDGRLSDDGEKLRLVYPDAPPAEDPAFVPYLTGDQVDYSAAAPWPDVTGGDYSITRTGFTLWSGDGSGWSATDPQPGSAAMLPGDANGDGEVNLDDFIILKQNYGSSPATLQQGDFSGDGAVDLDDFIILKQNYGRQL